MLIEVNEEEMETIILALRVSSGESWIDSDIIEIDKLRNRMESKLLEETGGKKGK